MTDFSSHFQILNQWLVRHRRWWQFQPFHHRQSIWRDETPALHALLSALSESEILDLSAQPSRVAQQLAPWIEDALLGVQVEVQLQQKLAQFSVNQHERLHYRVNGRKWQQIVALAQCVPPTGEIVEWCAGKAHLGRLLAFNGATTTSLEWQASLCESARELAARVPVDMTLVHCDVLSSDAAPYIRPTTHAVALHACGQLHTHLLQTVVAAGASGVTLAPCCYNLIPDAVYSPLSEAGQTSVLQLSRDDVSLPLKQTVTAGQREQRQRDQELAWRLGFDLLQRELRGIDVYLPLPTVPKSLLAGDFQTFCQWALARKQLDEAMPSSIRLAEIEQRGCQRRVEVRRMELVQSLFRRPLELWLLLDMILYLDDAGYDVTTGTFCDYSLTPRNWLIHAVKS
ncbi:Uncharacterised protein [BD1-7 clade bacterium]|uniref:Methyltransferase domain-containing protein n=1 Tax=BD1-7 clade bacterium TaxID=2029982 RepID=A0A5S9MVV2_9GAMM|nr:Uncharacterised protein [BD1-7 clade bacterium]CAA0083423.1 Uncharacterised protein [BD1-7 clade bacterium]